MTSETERVVVPVEVLSEITEDVRRELDATGDVDAVGILV